MFHSISWSILSNALWKSTKLMYSGVCHSMVFSIIIRKVAIWLTQDLSCLKPDCSSLNSLSSSFFTLFKIMLQRILLGIDSNIMPLQFLHRDLHLFWAISQVVLWASLVFVLLSRFCLEVGVEYGLLYQTFNGFWWYLVYSICFPIFEILYILDVFSISYGICSNV